jgi:hypothetical protein
MLTATRVRDGRAFYFVRDNPANAQNTGKLTLVDTVAASSAAPTYFQPWDVPGFGACVDGGVGIAGNPAYQQCVEAFEYTAGAYTPAETTMISLGTGYFNKENGPANFIQWAEWTLGELLHDPAEQQTQLMQRHYAPAGMRVFRENPALPRDIGLDDLGAIDELIAIGKAWADTLDWKTMLADEASAAKSMQPARLPRNRP